MPVDKTPSLIVVAEVTPVDQIVSLCMRIENKLSVTGTGKDNNSGAFINHSELLSVTAVAVLLLNACTVRGGVVRYSQTQAAVFHFDGVGIVKGADRKEVQRLICSVVDTGSGIGVSTAGSALVSNINAQSGTKAL